MRNTSPEDILEGLIIEGAKDQPAVDLMIIVHPQALDRVEIVACSTTPPRAAKAIPGLLARVREKIRRLRGRDPSALTTSIAECLAAFAANAEGRVKALEDLVSPANTKPLDQLPSSGRVNVRERLAAAEQVGLWLVARACLRGVEHKGTGVKLGEQALEAALRQTDPDQALAIFREWGKIESERGDYAAARVRWAKMLAFLDAAPLGSG